LYARIIFRHIDFDGKLTDNDFLQTDSAGNFITWDLVKKYSTYWLNNGSSNEIYIQHCTFTGMEIACLGPRFYIVTTSFCNVSRPIYCTGGAAVNIHASVNVVKCATFVYCSGAGRISFATINKQYTRI